MTSRPAASRAIWLINPFDDIPGEGLPPLRYWSLARALTRRGHEVVWWSCTWSHRRKAERIPPANLREAEGFDMRLVPVRPYRRNVSLARRASHADFGRNLERLATEGLASGSLRRPDVILASLPPLEGPEAAARLATACAAAFVLDVMDLWPETFVRLLPGPAVLRRVAAPLVFSRMAARRRRLVATADGLAAATHAYAAASFAPAPAAAPRHVCYVGADLATFPTVVPTLPGPLACVYAGSLGAGQDVDILPQVARILAQRGVDATIHIAGTGPREPALRRAAAASTGSCRLVMHGLLDDAAYRALLARCHVGLVCVQPSSRVAMPYKAGDYAAAGLALLNSLPGELADLLARSGAGLPYAPGNAASLAAAIASLAADRPQLDRLRQGARRLAEREFDRRHTYARFAEWIETAALHPDIPQTAAVT